MDILAALSDASPERGASRCGLGRWIDSIPADAPGRDELVRVIETPYDRADKTTKSGRRVLSIVNNLGHKISSENPIHEHRNSTCRCYTG